MQKFIEYLEEADKIIKAIDHLLYVTFPLVKDKKILVKILIELKKASAYLINSILQYEYLCRRVKLYGDAQMNFRSFRLKCASRYGLVEEEIEKIRELFEIIEDHKNSSMEFARNEKLVIMTERRIKAIDVPKIKSFLAINKKLMKNTSDRILRKV